MLTCVQTKLIRFLLSAIAYLTSTLFSYSVFAGSLSAEGTVTNYNLDVIPIGIYVVDSSGSSTCLQLVGIVPANNQQGVMNTYHAGAQLVFAPATVSIGTCVSPNLTPIGTYQVLSNSVNSNQVVTIGRPRGGVINEYVMNTPTAQSATIGGEENVPNIKNTNEEPPVLYVNNPFQEVMSIYVINETSGNPEFLSEVNPGQTRLISSYPGTTFLFGRPGEDAISDYVMNAVKVQSMTIGGAKPAPQTDNRNYARNSTGHNRAEYGGSGQRRFESARDQKTENAPRVQTSMAEVRRNGLSSATEIVGIGEVLAEGSKLKTAFRTNSISLDQEVRIKDLAVYKNVVQQPTGTIDINKVKLEFKPQVYAWYENGATYITIDTDKSNLGLKDQDKNYSDKDRGSYFEKIQTDIKYPQSFSLIDIFPTNEMDVATVTHSTSLTLGASAGPSPYSTNLNIASTSSDSGSANVPDYVVEVPATFNNSTKSIWKLCNVYGNIEKNGRCVYEDYRDMAHTQDKVFIDSLSELPTYAKHFNNLRHVLVLKKPGLDSSIVTVDFAYTVNLNRVVLYDRLQGQDEITKTLQGSPVINSIATAGVCLFDPNGEACKSRRASKHGRNSNKYSLETFPGSATFYVSLEIDLAPLASEVQRRQLQ